MIEGSNLVWLRKKKEREIMRCFSQEVIFKKMCEALLVKINKVR